MSCSVLGSLFFFFNDTAPTEIYTLSLHDALPISSPAPIHGATRTTPGAPPTSISRSSADRKSTRLNSSHVSISYAVFCLKKKKHRHVLHDPLRSEQSAVEPVTLRPSWLECPLRED